MVGRFDASAAGHTWTADNGDSGTYSGGGKTLHETWNSGTILTLTYSGRLKEYADGSFYLVRGATAGC